MFAGKQAFGCQLVEESGREYIDLCPFGICLGIIGQERLSLIRLEGMYFEAYAAYKQILFGSESLLRALR